MYQHHPAADIFPLMEGKEFDELVADIQQYGLREPIVLHEDLVLDGRNRYRACLAAGVKPEFVLWGGSGSPVAFVLSMNLHRRHLSVGQRAMVAERIANMPEGRPEITLSIERVSVEGAATALNVSPISVHRARKVRTDGAPELSRSVESGIVTVSTAADITELPQQEQSELVAKGEREILLKAKEIRAARTDKRRIERVEKWKTSCIDPGDLAERGETRKYGVIYADPPWRYEHIETENRAIENQYPTMELSAIQALPVSDVAADDCVLFLWATAPKLAEAMTVVESWGFNYRTCFVWVKDHIGMGYYCRSRHEFLLVCTRGTPPTPAPALRPDSVVEAPRGKHSEKPDAFVEIIETMYGDVPKIELFARQTQRAGWATWGNQTT